MKEIHIIFTRIATDSFSAIIEEVPEIVVTGSSLDETQTQIFLKVYPHGKERSHPLAIYLAKVSCFPPQPKAINLRHYVNHNCYAIYFFESLLNQPIR